MADSFVKEENGMINKYVNLILKEYWGRVMRRKATQCRS